MLLLHQLHTKCYWLLASAFLVSVFVLCRSKRDILRFRSVISNNLMVMIFGILDILMRNNETVQ